MTKFRKLLGMKLSDFLGTNKNPQQLSEDSQRKSAAFCIARACAHFNMGGFNEEVVDFVDFAKDFLDDSAQSVFDEFGQTVLMRQLGRRVHLEKAFEYLKLAARQLDLLDKSNSGPSIERDNFRMFMKLIRDMRTKYEGTGEELNALDDIEKIAQKIKEGDSPTIQAVLELGKKNLEEEEEEEDDEEEWSEAREMQREIL